MKFTFFQDFTAGNKSFTQQQMGGAEFSREGRHLVQAPRAFGNDTDLRIITSCKEQPSEGHFYVVLGFTLILIFLSTRSIGKWSLKSIT